MYVDESGDTGLVGSPTNYYILSGVVMHELCWSDYLDQLIDFRKRMLKTFGLHLREEIHSSEFISHPKDIARIQKSDRLTIIRSFANELATMSELNVINIIVRKTGKPSNYDVFENAWRALIQRFDNTHSHNNFRGPKNPEDKEMIIADNTDMKKLTSLVRKMRRFNPVPNNPTFGPGYRDLRIRHLIEDPNFRDSKESYFIQAADLIAYLLYQHNNPCSYMKKKSAQNYFLRFDPILCKVASNSDPLGIVWL
jgi:hypothetical protein